MIINVANLQAGKYFIGDPCYIMDTKIYDKEWGDKFDFQKGDFRLNGSSDVNFVVMGTAYGDGEYQGTHQKYAVDSGTLGLVHESLWDSKEVETAKDLGLIVEVESISVVFDSEDHSFHYRWETKDGNFGAEDIFTDDDKFNDYFC